MQRLILDVKADVEGGTSLHEALAKHPLYFDDLFVNLWKRASMPVPSNHSWTRSQPTRKNRGPEEEGEEGAVLPGGVLVVAVIVTVVLLLFVIPQFESLYKGFGADLPAFTQAVINISKFLQHNGIFMAIALGLAYTPSSISRSAPRPCANSSTGCRSRFRSSGPS